METFKRLLLGLDLSSQDKHIFSFVKAIRPVIPAQAKVYCLHVAPKLEVPVFAVDVHKEAAATEPVDERIASKLEDAFREVLGGSDLEVHFDVLEGRITQQLLHWTSVKNIDLAVVGRKHRERGSGLSAQRFMRKAHCSVLFVPEAIPAQIRRILVPVDFSDYSSLALNKALEIARRLPASPEINILHVYDVPTELQYQVSRTYERFAAMMRDNVISFYEDYIQKFNTQGLQLQTEFMQNVHANTARHIGEYAQEIGTDMIIMGAKGHSAWSSFLIGSVTERVLSQTEDLPLLIIRPPL